MTAAKAKQERRVEYVALDELVPAERNPKRHDLDALGRSFAAFGYVEPVVVDERTGRLVAGHGRLAELRALQVGGGCRPRRCDRRRRRLAGADVARVVVGG